MLRANIGHDADLRLQSRDQFVQRSWPERPQFNHTESMVSPQIQEGVQHPPCPISASRTADSRISAGQHMVDQELGRGLSAAAGDPNEVRRPVKLPVNPGQRQKARLNELEGLQALTFQ